MPEQKPEESFRVIDRRPFTNEGELRQEIVEEQEREARQEAKKEAAASEMVPRSSTLQFHLSFADRDERERRSLRKAL